MEIPSPDQIQEPPLPGPGQIREFPALAKSYPRSFTDSNYLWNSCSFAIHFRDPASGETYGLPPPANNLNSAHKMDSVCSLRIICLNSGINGSFLTYATEILYEPNFEDNHWPVLWNYGKIKHHSAEGNCHHDFMIQNDG